jgi:hypothetical protein
MAISQAFRSVADELMRMDTGGYGAPDFEAEAARRLKKQIEDGTWKPPARYDTDGLKREVAWVLEEILGGETRTRHRRRAPRNHDHRARPAAGWSLSVTLIDCGP